MIKICGQSTQWCFYYFFFLCSSHYTHFIPVAGISPRVPTIVLANIHNCLKRSSNVSKSCYLSMMPGFDCTALSHATVHTQVQSSRVQMPMFTVFLDQVPSSPKRIYELFMNILLDTNFTVTDSTVDRISYTAGALVSCQGL